MKEKILFIINPISGPGNKDWIEKSIERRIDISRYEVTHTFTEYAGHGKEIASEAVSNNIDIVVAVGGDGTINEIISQLINTPVKLGIVPLGSGNGLGRHVGISLNAEKALEIINHGVTETIDTCLANGFAFVNIAGVGFDAHISKVFNQGKKRGYLSYIKCTIQEYRNYKPKLYRCKHDQGEVEMECLSVAFANSQQYGNNAYIAPLASIKDGWMDVVFISPFPMYYWPVIIFKTLIKKLHTSSYIQSVRVKSVQINCNSPFPIHIDGEYRGEDTKVEVSINPASLNLIVGKRNI